MAHYAKISNAEFTVSERARLLEADQERNVIIENNISSQEYEDLKEIYDNTFTSPTLETLQSELDELQSQLSPNYPEEKNEQLLEDISDKLAEIDVEKKALVPAQEEALANLNAKELEGTSDLDEEINSLNETIKNALCRVTDVITGVDEYTSSGNEYFDGNDNTEYWESEYGNSKRTSYNTRAGVHKNGGTPFRKNYAGIGHLYDPVRDAFYSEQPYPSWVLNEDTCTWEAPEPPPGEAVWNEKTLEWVDYPNKPFKSWIHDTKKPSWNGDYINNNELTEGWYAPVKCPDEESLNAENPISMYVWDENNISWKIKEYKHGSE